ncbi:hypothetical protein R80B4_01660 [Fibrobacteres bacterium R8-0-B4]
MYSCVSTSVPNVVLTVQAPGQVGWVGFGGSAPFCVVIFISGNAANDCAVKTAAAINASMNVFFCVDADNLDLLVI